MVLVMRCTRCQTQRVKTVRSDTATARALCGDGRPVPVICAACARKVEGR